MSTADIVDTVQASKPHKATEVTDSVRAMFVRPSRFNARTVTEDGTLLLYNSYSGAFSGVPRHARSSAEALLRQEGTCVKVTGLAKYMLDRGFLVSNSVNELNKVRVLHGFQHYRSDMLELVLLASEACNFRCVYCCETYSRGTMEPWVRQAVVAMVEHRIKQLRLLRVGWFGGEPLLGLEAIREISPRLQDLAQANGVEFSAQMTTNGFLLTEKVLAELLTYGVRRFQISLDGSPADHDCKRGLKGGGSSFRTIYDNLKAARNLSEQFTIVVRINFDNDNLPHVQELLEMLERDFAGNTHFEILFHPVCKWGGPNDGNLNVCGSTAYLSGLALSKKASTMALTQVAQLSQMQGLRGGNVCTAARPYCFILAADGKIMKCSLPMDHEDYNIVGHLGPDGVPTIDDEKLARWVAPSFEDDDMCKKCFYLPVCQGCRCQNIRFTPGFRPCPEEKLNIAATLTSLWERRQSTARQYCIKADRGIAV